MAACPCSSSAPHTAELLLPPSLFVVCPMTRALSALLSYSFLSQIFLFILPLLFPPPKEYSHLLLFLKIACTLSLLFSAVSLHTSPSFLNRKKLYQ